MKRLGFALIGALWSFCALANNYVGDYAPGSTVRCSFGTVQPSTGASFALAGTPAVSVYKDGGTTESTTGVTLTASLDTRSAWAELLAARAAWEATAGTVQQATRAFEIADVRYRAGVSTQLELSDSRLLLQQ